MNTKTSTPTKVNAITPGANAFQFPCDAILVGVGGTITLESTSGDTATITVVAGQTVSLACTKVTAATATGLFALGY